MPLPGLSILVSGCDALKRKKLELCRDDYPDAQLFFTPIPSPDVLVLPAGDSEAFFGLPYDNRFSPAAVIAYGPVSAMSAALAAGCDDYLCSPWEPVELFERAFRCLDCRSVDIGTHRLYCRSGKVLCVGGNDANLFAEAALTPKEMQIMKIMTRYRGTSIGRKTLSELIGIEYSEGSRAADMYVSRLRKKLARVMEQAGVPGKRTPIITSSGSGWGIA